MKFAGKEISELTVEQLSDLSRQLKDISDKRELSSSHEKFNKDRQIGDRSVKRMQFPPPNQAFIKLQNEVNEEIKKRSMDKW